MEEGKGLQETVTPYKDMEKSLDKEKDGFLLLFFYNYSSIL